MGLKTTLQAPHGGADLLGWRRTQSGVTEIVYDDGVARRITWRVASPDPSEQRLTDALRVASRSLQVVPALQVELKKRAIAVERIAG
ncbi:MAG: hypothetical protein B7Z31_01055 [Rhodobacterales bacterium 12-65-15]|nr:MAG: hypothetical protein B7Z31_01055 [Rhodobacterales bacterium 12-65-15]